MNPRIPPVLYKTHEAKLEKIGKYIRSLLILRHAEVITEEAYDHAVHGLREWAVNVIEGAKGVFDRERESNGQDLTA